MSKIAQRQRNLAFRQFQGRRRHVREVSFVIKNTGTRKTVTVTSKDASSALQQALAQGLAKSIEKLVVVK